MWVIEIFLITNQYGSKETLPIGVLNPSKFSIAGWNIRLFYLLCLKLGIPYQ